MARILFIGAGGVGTYLGGWLAHTGHDVTLVDHWNEQIDKIRADGLEVTGPHDAFTAHPRMVHLHSAEHLAREEPFEIGFVAVKAYDTRWAACFIDPLVSRDGFLVSAQNCWPDPDVAEVVGEGRAIGLVMSGISVEMYEAGKVNRPGTKRQRDLGHDVFRAGEHDGSQTPRLQQMIDMLDPVDAGKPTANLWGERWAKLCQNCMGNPVVGVSGLSTAELAADPRCRQLQVHLARESAAIGLAAGIDVVSFYDREAAKWAKAGEDAAIYEEVDGMIARNSQGPNRFPSMGQDVAKGRISEIRMMNGHVLAKARELGIDVPVTEAIVDGMLKIDSGEWKQSRENIDKVLNRAGIAAPAMV